VETNQTSASAVIATEPLARSFVQIEAEYHDGGGFLVDIGYPWKNESGRTFQFICGLQFHLEAFLREINKAFALRRYPMIISGGELGVERAALDWAIERGLSHGGWCLKDRRTGDGFLPVRYHVRELPSTDCLQQKELNVRDSHGTAIFTNAGRMKGGIARLAGFADILRRPWIHLHADMGMEKCAVALRRWIVYNRIKVLNVAGPSESGIGEFVKRVLSAAFSVLSIPGEDRSMDPGTHPAPKDLP
jgi:hypothetical protein